MNRRTYALKEAEKIVPLLRAIGREIQSRRRAAHAIERRMAAVRSEAKPGAPEVTNLEAQLATHMREIRVAELELERFGCRLDAQDPPRILVPSPSGDWAFDGHLDDTRFYSAPAR